MALKGIRISVMRWYRESAATNNCIVVTSILHILSQFLPSMVSFLLSKGCILESSFQTCYQDISCLLPDPSTKRVKVQELLRTLILPVHQPTAKYRNAVPKHSHFQSQSRSGSSLIILSHLSFAILHPPYSLPFQSSRFLPK
jgi:hypothetical protein